MNISLNFKTALVCGASEGIGRAIAMELAASGANVIAVARSIDKLNEMKDFNPNIFPIAVDFQDYKSAVEITKQQCNINSIDILVNNAGGPPPGRAHEAAPEDFLKAFERHLFMSQLLTQSVLPGMKQRQFGRIINIISTSVRQPVDNLGVSNTLRGAMASWSKTLSKELRAYGITVNNLLPGQIKTGRLDSLIENRSRAEGKTIAEVEQAMIAKIPAGRLGRPEELAYAAVFLSSEYASFINGVNLAIDGGYLDCI